MYQSLEALRIISAILVVTAHLAPTSLPIVSWFFGGSVFLGSIGVDVFFIISGLVMGLTFQKRTIVATLKNRTQGFINSRLRKIFPLYLAATLLAVFIAPLFGRNFPSIDRLLPDLLLLPHMSNGRFIDPIIGVGWTLRYELFFYLVVFLGLLMNQRNAVTLIMVAMIFLPIDVMKYYSNPLLLEFLAGYLLASWFNRLAQPGNSVVRFLGLIVAAGLFLLVSMGKDFPQVGDDLSEIPRMLIYFGDYAVPRFVAWGLPALLLVIAAASLEKKIPRRLAALGKYTYSLYLMQYFCLPIENKLIARGWPEILALAATILTLSAVTAFSYSYIEKPFSVRGRFNKILREAR